ncbi:P-loop containing nucleoside triphosphate hydrolase protein [Zopfochytrium polystomum]|nr:P-loop containing nucleoside triphosphate hydrolase protein [Zopfochytrium polystomum]
MLPGRARARAKEAVVVAPPQSGATTHHQVVVEGRKRFTFDSVFPGTVSQETLYGTVAPLVDRFLEGMNVTVMAYGQTGTGKTYTMGSSKEYIAAGGANPESEGIIPRAMFDIFSKLNDAEVATSSSYTLTCTFLEIYNEDLIDLFAPKDLPLQDRPSILIQDAPNGTIKWTGCRELPLDSADAALQRFLQGLENRQTSSTEMNLTSSRSHAIFTLNLRRRVRQSQAFSSSSRATPTNSEWKTVSCRFNFVDLAGSERLQRTGTVGARQREGIFINSGLLALGNVISALSQESGRPMHVPYRDSKLTRLLQDSLGGNSNTLMIACVSPAESDLGETLNTLKYANRANRVKNIAVVNQEQSDAEIEIQRLRALVADLREEVDSLRTGGKH